MLLAAHQVSDIAREMLQLLTKEGDIETLAPREVQLDLEAVLNEYIRAEQELTGKARALLDAKGLPNHEFARVLKGLADQKNVKVGEEALDYVLEQLLSMLLNSSNVEEIYAEDYDLRRKLRAPFRKRAEVQQKVKKAAGRTASPTPQEALPAWEIGYQQLLGEIRRRKGL